VKVSGKKKGRERKNQKARVFFENCREKFRSYYGRRWGGEKILRGVSERDYYKYSGNVQLGMGEGMKKGGFKHIGVQLIPFRWEVSQSKRTDESRVI